MQKRIWIYGLILGTILCINAIYMMNLCMTNPAFESNDVLGYAAMIVVFSLTFFGIRNYRNKVNDGYISFGQAFKTGALIAFIGSTMYVVVGLSYYYLFAPEFLDYYIRHVLIEAERSGASAAELAKTSKQMAEFKEMYKNPLFAILITYAEVFPIGLVVALISALILKRKRKDDMVKTATV